MSANSKIEWTDHTFNPWWGCVEVSTECDNCYARDFAKRVGYSDSGSKFPIWGKYDARRFFGEKYWLEPLKWNASAAERGLRYRVFCASMADVFESGADRLSEERAKLWDLIESTPSLDWLLLTKRPLNIRKMVRESWMSVAFPENVWCGTTVGVRASEWRVEALRQVPARVLFLSCEPLLEEIRPDLTGINWVICGGESGPKARAMSEQWALSLRNQCLIAGVPFFMKQMGGVRDKRKQLADMPEYLRVREFPALSEGKVLATGAD